MIYVASFLFSTNTKKCSCSFTHLFIHQKISIEGLVYAIAHTECQAYEDQHGIVSTHTPHTPQSLYSNLGAPYSVHYEVTVA